MILDSLIGFAALIRGGKNQAGMVWGFGLTAFPAVTQMRVRDAGRDGGHAEWAHSSS